MASRTRPLGAIGPLVRPTAGRTPVRPASRNAAKAPRTAPLRVGVISDTHGLLRPEALDFLRGCDHIIHGGDIGGPAILHELSRLAPVAAVRGNNDLDSLPGLPDTEYVDMGGVRLYVIHDLARMRVDPVSEGIRVVVSGHSHKPLVEERGGVVFINPGSAGPRRFKLPISIGELLLDGTAIRPRIVTFG